MIKFFYSQRGLPLVFYLNEDEVLDDRSVLTVENYLKWYGLYLISKSDIVKLIDFPGDFADHVPDPKSVLDLARRNGWILDEQAYEMIIGRWELEYKENPEYMEE